jgi:hypothetical protein
MSRDSSRTPMHPRRGSAIDSERVIDGRQRTSSREATATLRRFEPAKIASRPAPSAPHSTAPRIRPPVPDGHDAEE